MELEVTWGRALKVWWAFIWRYELVVLGLIAVKMFFLGSISSDGINIFSFLTIPLIVNAVMKRNYGDFLIKVIKNSDALAAAYNFKDSLKISFLGGVWCVIFIVAIMGFILIVGVLTNILLFKISLNSSGINIFREIRLRDLEWLVYLVASVLMVKNILGESFISRKLGKKIVLLANDNLTENKNA